MSAARLLSVNVGLPKNVEWQGRTVFTGVYKQTLDGRCAVGYDPDPVEPPAGGSVLICCSQPHDDLVLDL